jgi:outer membrane protein assembly factor BamB
MPVIVDGTVYVADTSGTVKALDAKTGRPVWNVQLGSSVNGSPAVAGGVVVMGTDAGEVVALDVATGSVVWRFATSGTVRSSPANVGGSIFVGSEDGNVYALDVAAGHKQWSASLGAPVTRGVAVSAGVIYAGATGGQFSALDAASGVVRWSKTDLGIGEAGTPMVANGRVFVASGLLEVGPSDRLNVLAIADGSEQWSFATADEEPVYPGAVGGGAVFVSCTNGDV